MSDLTYEQARTLETVEGMPLEAMTTLECWLPVHSTAPKAIQRGGNYRLTPLAPLKDSQAAICLALGVGVQVNYGNGGKWRPARLADCCPSVHGYSTTSFRVPPESSDE